MRLNRFFCIVTILGLAARTWSQDLQEWTDSYISGLGPAKHFRGTILTERAGHVPVEKSYGTAVEEWQVRNSRQPRFEIASLSKQFTAAAILKLADNGKLSVEDPVSKYYPDSPATWKGMTIHHSHAHLGAPRG